MKGSAPHRIVSSGRRAGLGGVALLLLVAAVWTSWGTAQHVMLPKGREHGVLAVTGCDGSSCTGPYDPDGGAGPRGGMTIESSVAARKGDRFPVVVKPDTDEVIRTGAAGLFHAWEPLGGALLLASFVIGGGLRMPRAAWVSAVAGCALLMAAFLAL